MPRLGLLLLGGAVSASAFRIIDRRDPAHLAAVGDSYIAAVGQTIFSDGGADGGCCPSVLGDDANADASRACPGAEPLGPLPPCVGTPAEAMNATKMGNISHHWAVKSFIIPGKIPAGRSLSN